MKTYLYLFVMAATTYLIRFLPLTLIRKPIQNPFLRSFLFYVPYVTLAVMTFPAIMNATQSPIAGAAAMVISALAARRRGIGGPEALVLSSTARSVTLPKPKALA